MITLSAGIGEPGARANPEQMDSFAMTNLRLKQIDRAFSVNQCEPEMPEAEREERKRVPGGASVRANPERIESIRDDEFA